MAHDTSPDGVADEFTTDSESDGIGDGCVLNSPVDFSGFSFYTKGHHIENVELDDYSPTESGDSEVSSSSVDSEDSSSGDWESIDCVTGCDDDNAMIVHH